MVGPAQMHQVREQIIGCIVGCAIGDAVGGIYEGRKPPINVAVDPANWRLSDDTQLTLATCEGIVAAGWPDPESIAEAFRRWYRAGRIQGVGASTLKALRDLDIGTHWALSGAGGEQSAGNGAAMRIAPLAFFLDPGLEEERATIRHVSRITHRNDEAYVGALAVILAIRAGIAGEWSRNSSALHRVAQQLPDTNVRDGLLEAAKMVHEPIAIAATELGASGYVAESVPFALFAVQRLADLGFGRLITEVVAAGGDTDTNAAIAGAVAGAILGQNQLPQDWVSALPERDEICGTAESLAALIPGAGSGIAER